MASSPHVVVVESRPIAGGPLIYRATCTICLRRSAWSFALSEAAASVWFAPAAVPLVA